MSPSRLQKAINLLYRFPHFERFCCCEADFRIISAIFASIGIVLDIHIFNTSISLTMICFTDFQDTLRLEIDKFCAQIWFLTIGGLISFISGILYIVVTIPALICDALQLFGMIPTIPNYVLLLAYTCLPIFLLRLVYVAAAVYLKSYFVFAIQIIGLAIGGFWWFCTLTFQIHAHRRRSTMIFVQPML